MIRRLALCGALALTVYCLAYLAVSPLLVFTFITNDSLMEEEFWKGRRVYHVSMDDPQAPKQIAGPLDAWAGSEKKDIVIHSPYAGRVTLTMDIPESHESDPPVIGVYANGKPVTRFHVPRGTGRPVLQWGGGKHSQLNVEIAPGLLDNRTPEITLRSESGSWAGIDDIEIRKLPPQWVYWVGPIGLLFLALYGAWRITSERVWKAAIVNGALVLGSTTFALAMAEAGLRTFLPQRDFAINLSSPYKGDPDTEHLLLENVISPMGFDTNRFGMRDYDHYTKRKPAGVYRILALGDSFTQGMTKLEDTWPKALERMFEGSVPRVEVLNAGVNGYGQDNEYFYLKKYGLDFEPDMAFMAIFNGNDIGDNCEHNTRTVVDGILVKNADLAKMGVEEIKREKQLRLLVNKSHIYRLFKNRDYGGVARFFQKNSAKVRKDMSQAQTGCIPNEAVYAFKVPENWDQDIAPCWTNTVDYINKMQALTREKGVKLAMALLPAVTQFKSEETEAIWLATKNFDARYPQKLFMDEAAKRGWPMMDAMPYMDSKWDRKERIHYCGDIHYNELGNRLLAEVIFQWIMKEKMIPFTTPPKSAAHHPGGK